VTNPEDIGRTDSTASGFEHNVFDPLTDDFLTKERKYIHFDNKLSETERSSISLNNTDLATHDFWPLLAFEIKARKKVFNDAGELIGFKPKPRKIKFGSHYDAALLEIYSKRISTYYESKLRELGLADTILAYRSGVGDNIHQAKNIFNIIKSKKNCTAIALDIKGFFDNIQHETLKLSLAEILSVEPDKLPTADYQIWKNICRFSYVKKEDVIKRVGEETSRNYNRLCFPKDFRNKVRKPRPKIIKSNKNEIGEWNNFGIPQGTPISGLYANISLLDFDERCKNFSDKIGAIYRRYSDDIAIILPEGKSVDEVLSFINESLEEIGLKINPTKTEVSVFSSKSGKIVSDHRFQYLGFLFDGQKVLIRQSSLNNYYKKMKKGIRSKLLAAKKKEIPKEQIFLRDLYKSYTHYGRRRNFPRYAYRASDIFNSPDIRAQIKPHMKKFKRVLKEEIESIYTSAPKTI